MTFVANSSSSSFIIAYKDIKNYEGYDIPEWLLKQANKMLSLVTNSKEKMSTKEELDKWFIDTYGWKNMTLEELLKEEDYLEERYNKMVSYIDEYSISCLDVENGEGLLQEFLSDLPSEEDGCGIVIIDGSN